MKIIQNIYALSTPRFFATAKILDKEIGLTQGKVEVYGKGDTLFYSDSHILPRKAGFERIITRKAGYTQNRLQVSLPLTWYREYCKDITHLRVYYTEIGLFVKPYYTGISLNKV